MEEALPDAEGVQAAHSLRCGGPQGVPDSEGPRATRRAAP